jgi:hypothetical protein
VHHQIIGLAFGVEGALDEVIVVGGDDEQRRGNIGEEGVERREGIIAIGWCSKSGDMLLASVHKPLFSKQ